MRFNHLLDGTVPGTSTSICYSTSWTTYVNARESIIAITAS
ncbi:unnamed protein product [Acanthoscelides obtectus]|uniref:Uncharacterized protein n=1 Tax=Acanthoscelides obtectus TaxID=200917 RepID=A0A9P0JZX6_ACAOB|nr:unnamed protein product [Acanthoscelides obtectus]CAK1632064.1 hypothetical protein AOBTE_LOCUS7339 [Acanthoscelides obtectus]